MYNCIYLHKHALIHVLLLLAPLGCDLDTVYTWQVSALTTPLSFFWRSPHYILNTITGIASTFYSCLCVQIFNSSTEHFFCKASQIRSGCKCKYARCLLETQKKKGNYICFMEYMKIMFALDAQGWHTRPLQTCRGINVYVCKVPAAVI